MPHRGPDITGMFAYLGDERSPVAWRYFDHGDAEEEAYAWFVAHKDECGKGGGVIWGSEAWKIRDADGCAPYFPGCDPAELAVIDASDSSPRSGLEDGDDWRADGIDKFDGLWQWVPADA